MAEGILMGLQPEAFARITYKQFIVLRKKYWEKFKSDKETDSAAVYHAISNAFREEGAPYQELFAETKELTQEEIERENEEYKDFFGDGLVSFEEGEEVDMDVEFVSS